MIVGCYDDILIDVVIFPFPEQEAVSLALYRSIKNKHRTLADCHRANTTNTLLQLPKYFRAII